MFPDGRRIGTHLPLGMGMVRAAERAAEIGAEAIQVFSDNPTAWRRRAAPPEELTAFRKRLEALSIAPLAIHASYLVNLAGPDDELWERSVAVLADELETAALYGAALVNVHIGSHRGRGADYGLARVAEAVVRAFGAVGTDAGPVLVLENSAGGGFGIGADVGELAAILAGIDAHLVPRERVGICLDAAHLWSAGYRISDPNEVDALLEEFDRAIGLDRLRLVHLNDSRSELGAHTDRHQHIGAGQIGAAGLRRLVTHPALAGVTYVLETPGMDEGYDAVNMDRVRRLIGGQPLPDLGPHELDMRGSRSRSAPADQAAGEVAAVRPGSPPGRPRVAPSRGEAISSGEPDG